MSDTFTRDSDGRKYKVVGGTKYNPPGKDYEMIKPMSSGDVGAKLPPIPSPSKSEIRWRRKMNYRETARRLNVHYLFGRWGFTLWHSAPDSDRQFRPHLVPLDGWSFDTQEIIESFANDPAFSISYKEK